MGGIPLVASQVNTNFPSPLDEYMRAEQLKSSINQQQLQQQQISMGQMELTDQKNLRALAPQYATKDADGKVTGFDYDNYYNAALQQGVNPQTIAKMRMSQAQMTEALAKSGTATLDLHEKTNDQAYQLAEGFRDVATKPGADPNQVQQAYQGTIMKLRQLGIPTNDFPAQYAGPDSIDHFVAGLAVHKQVLADAKTQAETEEAAQKTLESKQKTALDQIEAELKQGQAEFYKKNNIPAGIPLDTAEAASWMASHQGKSLADYMRFKSTLPITTRYSLETGAGVPPALPAGATPDQQGARAAQVAQRFGMTPQAFDQTAEKYFQSGTLPSVGRGISGIALQRAIMNRTGELHPGESLAEGSSEFKANAEALKKLQTQFDTVTAFENTAEKNINRLLETAKTIPDLGVKFANVPLRMITGEMIGTENMARFKADLATAQNEAAKVLNSANLSGTLSDTARKEVQELSSGNLPYSSLAGAMDELKRDMANRKQSYSEQIGDIQTRMKGRSAAPPPTTTPTGATAPGQFDWNRYKVHEIPKP